MPLLYATMPYFCHASDIRLLIRFFIVSMPDAFHLLMRFLAAIRFSISLIFCLLIFAIHTDIFHFAAAIFAMLMLLFLFASIDAAFFHFLRYFSSLILRFTRDALIEAP